MKPSINIRLYPQTQTVATNVYHYDCDGQLTEMTDTRFIVDHLYEIIYPIYEKYGNTHDITVHSMGKRLDVHQLEQDFYNYINGVMEHNQ